MAVALGTVYLSQTPGHEDDVEDEDNYAHHNAE